ncbi:DNA/RNA polymerase [Annulohypoxylon maeteangense]|uniref:DNA/RNA polymerase n=1 Tax=Annulohypoxylon maeteangense TaxID=1927788 RepID=UPI002007E5A9|nr:DNA/RNA polymerase [Annulohypoxylon maeteangense]KAI0884729.1 DNA/RNA polymerase [Annulohypoxylon maeteangense]
MKTTALTSGLAKTIANRPPRRNDDRVIIHFDYDCFYASVFENANPALKGLPLGVKQKSILATCNYAARARGVKKLMLISEAQKVCPDLVIVNGEDLTPFRDASKKLWSFLRSHSWSDRVERLGLDEVFLDVTDVVAYNQELLNRNALRDSFFQLSRQDPEKGFSFDASGFFGCVQPKVDAEDAVSMLGNPSCARLLLASHLAGYLRLKLEEDFGYTSSCGVSTNKTLAKLAGSVNKPRNQTTLPGLHEDDIQDFMDGHKLRQIPGIGSRIAQLVQDHVLSTTTVADSHDFEIGAKVTVRDVRLHPGLSADMLERILDRPGSERGSGEKVWNLLHGVDTSEVKEASDVPTQISIEDTYMSKPLNTPAEITRELHALATSLVKRMRVDLTTIDEADPSDPTSQHQEQPQLRWAAYPKTLRLSTRCRPKNTATGSTPAPESFSRSSRSQPLPSYVLNLKDESVETVAERLASEALLPLFRRLHAERQGWNLALINICVTNMVMMAGSGESGNGAGMGGGRNIARMFRTQEDKLREWTVYDTTPVSNNSVSPSISAYGTDNTETREEKEDEMLNVVATEGQAAKPVAVSLDPDEDAWEEEEEDESQRCHLCGHAIPIFATLAHERFHSIGD